MMIGLLNRTAMLVCLGAMLFLFAADRRDPAPLPPVLLGTEQGSSANYMPLRPGRVMTYASAEGDRFSLTFLEPITIQWFDGTQRVLHPVHDERCGCNLLLEDADGEVRAVGAIEDGRVDRWGEYIVILPRGLSGPRRLVETPAGKFEQAVRYETDGGTAWFAPGVGLVQTAGYQLIRVIEIPASPPRTAA